VSELGVRTFEGTPALWDRMVGESPHPSFFQLWGWGEFKGQQAWKTCRLSVQDAAGTVLAGCQVLVRKPLPGFGYAWIPGGPFPLQGHSLCPQVFQALRGHLQKLFPWSYLRIYLMQATEPALEKVLTASLRKPLIPLNSGKSTLVNIKSSEAEFLEAMTGKHRYYVRQAQKHMIRWESEIHAGLIQHFSDLMGQMGRIKGKRHLALSPQTLAKLVETCSAGMRMVVGFVENQAVTGAVVLTQGTRAWYLHAASNQLGRRLGASYAMVAELARSLRQDGILEMDFGGLGPDHPDFHGPNHFKKGFGGKPVTYAGEWEAGGRLSRCLGNAAVFFLSR